MAVWVLGCPAEKVALNTTYLTVLLGRRLGGSTRQGEQLSSVRLGVVAFSTLAVTELGDYDETSVLLLEAGELPAPFDET